MSKLFKGGVLFKVAFQRDPRPHHRGDHLSQRVPHTWQDLWKDRRDVKMWWLFWIELVSPSAVIALTGNAIWIVVLVIRERNPTDLQLQGSNSQNLWLFGQLLAVSHLFFLFLILLKLIKVAPPMNGTQHSL